MYYYHHVFIFPLFITLSKYLMNTTFIPETATYTGIKWRAKYNPSLHCLLMTPKYIALSPTTGAVSVGTTLIHLKFPYLKYKSFSF